MGSEHVAACRGQPAHAREVGILSLPVGEVGTLVTQPCPQRIARAEAAAHKVTPRAVPRGSLAQHRDELEARAAHLSSRW